MPFVKFMAEMKHPYGFWKRMLCAQIFIYTVYMLSGLFVYFNQRAAVLGIYTNFIVIIDNYASNIATSLSDG